MSGIELPLESPFEGDATTFVIDLNGGGSIRWEWGTEIIEQRGDGRERRKSFRPRPRVYYKFQTLLDDAAIRSVRGMLVDAAAQASTFFIGLAHEALFQAADASGDTVFVHAGAMALCDWKVAGQRVLVQAPDGTTSEGTIQSVTATEIVLDIAPGGAGVVNGRIMPSMEIYLDGTQGFDRYAQKREHWELNGIGLEPGFVGSVSTLGTGATLTTILGIDGSTIPIFDRGIVIAPTNSNSIIPTAQRVDLGYLVTMKAVQEATQFGRGLFYKRASRAEFQWLKKFLFNVRGRNKRFLLPTGRPDLVAAGDGGASDELLVDAEAQYAIKWFPFSDAHRHAAIRYNNGVIDYRRIDDAVNEGADDRITFNTGLSGAFADINMISILELCRLDSDAIEISWQGPTFTFNQTARVVLQ